MFSISCQKNFCLEDFRRVFVIEPQANSILLRGLTDDTGSPEHPRHNNWSETCHLLTVGRVRQGARSISCQRLDVRLLLSRSINYAFEEACALVKNRATGCGPRWTTQLEYTKREVVRNDRVSPKVVPPPLVGGSRQLS